MAGIEREVVSCASSVRPAAPRPAFGFFLATAPDEDCSDECHDVDVVVVDDL